MELDVACAAGGVCSCLVDRETVHTCQNLIHDPGLTFPGTACCGRYFADLTAGR